MAYIFMDESGDLGFNQNKEKSSKNFIIAFLFSENKNILDKLVKKVFKNLPPNIKKNHSGTFHCYKEQPKIRLKILNLLKEKVEIKTPSQEKALQIIDFIAWSVFRKYEHNDDSYYNIIKNLIIEDTTLYE